MAQFASCPYCRVKIKFPERVAGRQVRCPKCHREITLPGAEADLALDDGERQRQRELAQLNEALAADLPQVKPPAPARTSQFDVEPVHTATPPTFVFDDEPSSSRRMMDRAQLVEQPGLRANNLFGILGAVGVAVAVFLPAWTIPVMGSVSLWEVKTVNVPIEAWFILAFALLSFVLSFQKTTWWLLLPAVCILATGIEVLVRIERRLENLGTHLAVENAVNRMLMGGRTGVQIRDVLEAENVAGSITLGVAWIVLAVALVFLITSACLSRGNTFRHSRLEGSALPAIMASAFAVVGLACVAVAVVVTVKPLGQPAPVVTAQGTVKKLRAAAPDQPAPVDPKLVEFHAAMKRFIDEATSVTRAMELLPDRVSYQSRTAGVEDAYSRIPDPPGRDEKLTVCHKAARQITVDFGVGDLQLHFINEFLRLGSTADADKAAQQFRELASSQKAKLRELEAALNERRMPNIELSAVIRGQ